MNALPFNNRSDRGILFGRERERELLARRLDECLAGRGSLLLISGEAGIGKTTLVEWLGQTAAERGATVLTGCCYDLSATPPYGPWIEILGPDAARESPIMLRTTGGSTYAPGPDALFEQIFEHFRALAGTSPAVMIFDDLQWSDVASLELLRFIARRISGSPMLIVSTYREEEISAGSPLFPLLPILVREAKAERIELRSLDAGAIREWLAHSYDLPEDRERHLADHLLERTDGNPFYAGEILRSLEDDAILEWDGEQWALGELRGVATPALLRQVIHVRLQRVSEETRGLLAVAAVIGQDVEIDLWKRIAGTTDAQILDAIDEAIAAWLLIASPDGTRASFRHGLIRSALYEAMLPPRRRVWHQRIAEELSASDAPDPDAVAHHFGQTGDLRTIEWLHQAGDRAWKTWAWHTAAERFRSAIDLLEGRVDRAEERAWMLVRLAEARRYSAAREALGYVAEASQIAHQLHDPALIAMTTWSRGRIRVQTNVPSLSEMESAIDQMHRLSPEDRARLASWTGVEIDHCLAVLAVWRALCGRYREALEAAASYLASNPARRAPLIDAEAYLARGVALGALGNPGESRQAFHQALDLYTNLQDNLSVAHVALLYLVETLLPYFPDDLAERARIASEGDRAWMLANEQTPTAARIVSPPLLLLEGQWEATRETVARTVGLRHYVRYWMSPYGAIMARAQGDPDLARAYIRAGLPMDLRYEEGILWVSFTLMHLRTSAELELDRRDADAAREAIEQYDEIMKLSGKVTGRSECSLIRARYHQFLEDVERAEVLAERALHEASNPRQPLAQLAAQRFLGELATGRSDFQRAEAYLNQAASLAVSCGAAYEHALVLADLAELYLTTRDLERSKGAIEMSRALSSDLEAEPLDERLDHLADQIAGAADTRSYPDGLTQREVEVLRLVTDGSTDAEIAGLLHISPRTVTTHVGNILGKTNSNSRAAAAAYAVRRGLA